MSMDPSLKGAASLIRHRNVLSRAERIARLMSEGKWSESSHSPLGLVKVGNRKLAVGSKPAKKDDASAAPAGKAAPAAKGAAAGKAAPAAKGAPAAKAAPAAKGAPAAKAAPAKK